ncbi:MAG: hypothetical protein OEV42_03115 [Deltaproteobacteria bacterium]|nr:hypothetical protein [Deltaproteobacteria bacterium]
MMNSKKQRHQDIEMNLIYEETLPQTEVWENPLPVAYGMTSVPLPGLPELTGKSG